jgi:DNA-binding transcriptional regulator YiaG
MKKALITLNKEQELEFNKLVKNVDKIRYLRFICNFSRADVARYLNIIYQYVRNTELVSTEDLINKTKTLIK